MTYITGINRIVNNYIYDITPKIDKVDTSSEAPAGVCCAALAAPPNLAFSMSSANI